MNIKIDRRDALKTIATGVGAVATLPLLRVDLFGQTAAALAVPEALRFFTPHEHQTVEALAELIIPADSWSPGAGAARVHDYIDVVVSTSPDEIRSLWRNGLAELDRMASGRSGADFLDTPPGEQAAILVEISRNEFEPVTLAERFFRETKTRTIQGYYTSRIGLHEELRYQGNAFLLEFPGCAHAEHKVTG